MKPTPQSPTDRPPRLFGLYRHEDPNRRSGTGLVAWGVIWPNGEVSTWWAQSPVGVHQITTWHDLNEIAKTHGHGHKTRIVALGLVAAVEQFDTAPIRERLRDYQNAAATGPRDSVAHLLIAMQICTALPDLLDRHEALAAAYAAQAAELDARTTELEELRAEHTAMQAHLDAIADTHPQAGQPAA